MALTRRKSCFECARGKRRCDLDFPECGRCLAKRVTCEYAWISPKDAQAVVQNSCQSSWAAQVVQDDSQCDRGGQSEWHEWTNYQSGLGETHDSGGVRFELPVPLSTTPLTLPSSLVPLVNEITSGQRIISYLSPECHFQSSDTSCLDAASISGVFEPPLIASDSFDNTDGTWQSRAGYAAGRLALQPRALAEMGHTAFIHPAQLEVSPILRDTLAACSMDAIRNSVNELFVRSHIMRQANLLLQATEIAINPTSASSHSNMGLDLLSAVQGMLIYQCLRLFSTDDAAAQAQAERDFEPLSRWVDILHAQSQHFKNASDPVLGHTAWKYFIRIESTRRTIIFAELLNSVYTYLKFACYRPSAKIAKVPFTGQTALWGARSAADWRQVIGRRPCFKITISTFHDDVHMALPDDLDELGILIRTSYDGVDAVREWLGDDKRLLERWGLETQDGFPSSSH